MSKKKASTTMTLKDFHGGSIPSDLPLPSAPGVSVRQPDRAGYDRPLSGGWGMGGRLDPHRLSRPGSAGGGNGSRGFVDEVAAPFLPSTARIGRNFDEDERKPFDASSAPRRAAAVEVDHVRLPRSGTDAKPSLPQQQQLFGRPGSSPAAVPQHLTGGLGFPAAGIPPSQQLSGSGSGDPAAPNAWGVRKEAPSEPQVQQTSTWSGPAAASRFAQASAIEKISSGRWQSKPLSFGQTADVEVIGSPEFDRGSPDIRDNGATHGVVHSNQSYNERVNAFDGRHNEVVNGRLANEQARSPVIPEVNERIGTMGYGHVGTRPESSEGQYGSLPVPQREGRLGRSQAYQQEGRFNTQEVQQLEGRLGGLQVTQRDRGFDGLQMHRQGEQFGRLKTPQQEGKINAPQVYQQGTAEISERPKLKLLPRSKPLESSEVYALDSKQGNQSLPAELGMANDYNETHVNLLSVKPESSGTDGGNGNPAVDRPRLNLKPRSQPLEKSEETIKGERKTLFGGARPRELVLKERGMETAPNDIDQSLSDSRIKHELSKVDIKSDSVASPRRLAGNAEGYPFEHRPARDTERKDFRSEPERLDMQRNSRKNDNWRNNREIEKPQAERHPEPDSWRKPVEEQKPEVPGQRYGKAASALELAQAFSRSVSDTGSDSRLTSQRGVHGHNQVPFSRLTENREIYTRPTPRKINGY